MGKVNCFVVKDLSRFGRNYTKHGNFIEKIFPFLRVRVVKVNDNLDTLFMTRIRLKSFGDLRKGVGKMDKKDERMLVNQESLVKKIYIIRGQKVMLDFELAEIYGYETKNFNRQVKNNIEKFEGEEFMFQLTTQEIEEFSRCKNFTLSRGTGRGSNIKYNPYAFNEYVRVTKLRYIQT